MSLIGLTGLAGSGKDCVAALLGMVGYERRAFADDLRKEVAAWVNSLQVPTEVLFRADFGELGALYGPDIWHAIQSYAITAKDVYLKPTPPLMRKLLQRHGTEYRRAQDPEYWVRKVFGEEDLEKWRIKHNIYGRLLVISDVRFPNEVEAIKARGGAIWRVVRPDVRPLDGGHSSETGIAGLEVDREILNDGSLWDLQKRVSEALGAL